MPKTKSFFAKYAFLCPRCNKANTAEKFIIANTRENAEDELRHNLTCHFCNSALPPGTEIRAQTTESFPDILTKQGDKWVLIGDDGGQTSKQ
jgi:hypothetical protein